MREIIQMLVEKGIAAPNDIHGCTEYEIRRLEEHYNTQLPQRYRDFLLAMGRGAGGFFVGIDCFYGILFVLRQWTDELLEENNVEFQLPDDVFIFSMHQGYVFNYFRVSEGDDPPVYRYIEGDVRPKRIATSFSEYLIDNVTSHVQQMEKMRNLRRSGHLGK